MTTMEYIASPQHVSPSEHEVEEHMKRIVELEAENRTLLSTLKKCVTEIQGGGLGETLFRALAGALAEEDSVTIGRIYSKFAENLKAIEGKQP